ncbi:formin-like protein 20 [Prosopis cineraria]|uniref:formin-like protein 20 n=1 Tax=Prosopis cineraria TaxID=364024 RepID=UPI00240F2447|nr:formin-like protein 20 [Prosopis cineraria]
MLLLNTNTMNPNYDSPTSSPPTPSSPLPVSFGPGNRQYSISASSTPSPPFSPAPSSQASLEQEKIPLLQEDPPTTANLPSVFSLDLRKSQELEPKSTCLQELLEWFVQRCCSCCIRFFESSNRDINSQ